MTSVLDFGSDYPSAATLSAPGQSTFSDQPEREPQSGFRSGHRPLMRLRLLDPSISPRRTRNATRALSRLAEIGALPERWDGLQAAPAAIDALVVAAHLLVTLSREDELRPHLVPLPSGGVQLEWHVAGNSLEIEVDHRGMPHLFAARVDDEAVLDDEPSPGRMAAAVRQAQDFLDFLAGELREAR